MVVPDDLLTPRIPIGQSFVPARSPLVRYSECQGSAVLAHHRTREVARLAPTGVWLWMSADGSRTVGQLLAHPTAGGPAAAGSALMAIRRLRALGMLVEAGRATCLPPGGRPGDSADEGTFVVSGSVDCEVLIVGGAGASELEVMVGPLGVMLPGGTRAVALRAGAGPNADPLPGLVRAMAERSWERLGAFDLAAAAIDHLSAAR